MTRTVPQVDMVKLESMAPEAARVLIAQDVLALQQGEAIQANAGRYINHSIPQTVGYDAPVHQIFELWLGRCEVCALGAAMVAAVRRFDALTVGELCATTTDLAVRIRPQLVDYLGRFFPAEQIDLIEIAFENGTHMMDSSYLHTLSSEQRKSAIAFRRGDAKDDEGEFTREADRAALQRIFQNIIENNGTFIP